MKASLDCTLTVCGTRPDRGLLSRPQSTPRHPASPPLAVVRIRGRSGVPRPPGRLEPSPCPSLSPQRTATVRGGPPSPSPAATDASLSLGIGRSSCAGDGDMASVYLLRTTRDLWYSYLSPAPGRQSHPTLTIGPPPIDLRVAGEGRRRTLGSRAPRLFTKTTGGSARAAVRRHTRWITHSQ